MNQYHAAGASAENLVASKLLDLGFSVALPVVDEGYDLIVNYSTRVQVKSSTPQARGLGFSFNIPRLRSTDVVVLVGRTPEEDRYWIVPITVFAEWGGSVGVSIPTAFGRRGGRPHRFKSLWKFENAWQVFGAFALVTT